MNDSRLISLMHRIASQSDKSIEQQCDDIYGEGMKSHWTYRKELNPTEEYARFPAEKLAAFCLSNHNIAPLEYIADLLGCDVRRRDRKSVPQAGPSALISAVSLLMELAECPTASRIEMSRAVNRIIEEAEAVVYRRFPDQVVAFSRRPIPRNTRPFWRRIFRRE